MIKDIKIKAMKKSFDFSKRLVFFLLALTIMLCNLFCFYVGRNKLLSKTEKLLLDSAMLIITVSFLVFFNMLRLDLKGKSFYSLLKIFFFVFLMFLIKSALFVFFFSPAITGTFLFRHMSLGNYPFHCVCIYSLFMLLIFIVCTCFFNKAMRLLFLSQYFYVIFENPKTAIAKSIESMQDKTFSLLRLKLSFFGWFFLCLFILPIPYVQSYYGKCLEIFADEQMSEAK